MNRAIVAVLACGCLTKPSPPSGIDAGGDGGVGFATDRIAAGKSHACALSSGALRCWGDDSQGQLGKIGLDATPMETGQPTTILDISGWTDVAAGYQHTCAITNDEVYCWGRDQEQEVGTASGMPTAPAFKVPLPSVAQTPMRVFAGDFATCAIDSATQLVCWGQINGVVSTPTIVAPAGMPDGWGAVALSEDHACALQGSGAVYCWGANDSEQLGVPSAGLGSADAAHAVSKQSPSGGPDTFVAIAARGAQTCGVRMTDGSLVCWGSPANELFGSADVPSDDAEIDATHTWTSVVLGEYHACAIDSTGATYCWGSDQLGALGIGLDTPSALLQPTTPMLNTSAVVAGSGFTCAIATDFGRSTFCWGQNAQGQLGNGEIATTLTPTKIQLGKPAAQIAVGTDHACALIDDPAKMTVYCWGDNTRGQLFADGTSRYVTTPEPDQAPVVESSISQLVAGASHTCVEVAGPSTSCWGDNTDGQNPGNQPLQLIAAGENTTCGITGSGQPLTCWGIVPGLELVGSMDYQVPDAVWQQFAVGSTLAVGTTDGKDVYEFGSEPNIGTVPPYDFPNPVGTAGINSATVEFAVGDEHACGMFVANVDSELDCWGDNTFNQVSSSPSQMVTFTAITPLGSGTNWSTGPQAVSAAGAHTCAIDDKFQLECWGDNSSFALGGLPSENSEPTLVPYPGTHKGWTQVSTGANDTCAIDVQGDVYCWGYNEFGEAGNGKRFYGEPVMTAAPN